MKILYSFPSRSRPDKLFDALKNIIEMATHDNWEINVKSDLDDPSMFNEAVIVRLGYYNLEASKVGGSVKTIWGESKTKMEAINRDIPKEGFDILILMSDDFYIAHKGLDSAIVKVYEEGFSGICHIPDAYANERLCTFPIMDKAYYDLDGYVYHPSYESVFGDNEAHEVAIKRGKYKYLPMHGALIHKHWFAGYGQPDQLLERNEHPTLYAKDRRTFAYRQSNNFFL